MRIKLSVGAVSIGGNWALIIPNNQLLSGFCNRSRYRVATNSSCWQGFGSSRDLKFTHELIVRQEPCENDSNFIDTLEQGVKANREALRQKGKLEIPVLAVYGALSNTAAGTEEMMCELANRAFGLVLVSPDAARSVAEENPRGFVDSLLSF
jgi:hypothetical protein